MGEIEKTFFLRMFKRKELIYHEVQMVWSQEWMNR